MTLITMVTWPYRVLECCINRYCIIILLASYPVHMAWVWGYMILNISPCTVLLYCSCRVVSSIFLTLLWTLWGSGWPVPAWMGLSVSFLSYLSCWWIHTYSILHPLIIASIQIKTGLKPVMACVDVWSLFLVYLTAHATICCSILYFILQKNLLTCL